MSDNNDFLGMNEKGRLSADITFLMLKGGGYALVFCLLIWLVIAVIAGIGRALPEESRDTADPTPTSALELPVEANRTILV